MTLSIISVISSFATSAVVIFSKAAEFSIEQSGEPVSVSIEQIVLVSFSVASDIPSVSHSDSSEAIDKLSAIIQFTSAILALRRESPYPQSGTRAKKSSYRICTYLSLTSA